MLLLLLSWILILWLSTAFGIVGWKLTTHFINKNYSGITNLKSEHIVSFGFLIISMLVSYISIFSAIDLWIKISFLIIGIIITSLHFHVFKQLLNRNLNNWKSAHFVTKVLIFILFFTTLFIGSGKIIHYDTLYYHLQTIQWIETYPVVPGLGNIHTRLAYNSHFFLPSALFSISLTKEYILYPLNSFFFFGFATMLLFKIDGYIQTKSRFNFILNLCLLLLFIYHCLPFVNSTSTDATTSLLMYYVFFIFIEWRQKTDYSRELLILLAVVAFTVVTYKLSSLLLLLLLPFTFTKNIIQRATMFAVIGCIIFTPFFIRNYYLSGYLIFPHPDVDLFEVDWKVPQEEAFIDEKFIEVWSKLPNGQRSALETYQDAEIVQITEIHAMNWLLPWFTTFGFKWKLILFINLLSFPILLLAIYKKHYTIAILAFVLLVNFAFWLLKAPNPRFGYGILFMAFSLNIAYILYLFIHLPILKMSPYLAALGIFIIFMINPGVLFKSRAQGFAALLLPERLDSVPTKDFAPLNFTLHTPAGDRRCYNTPIPCTPYPKKNLMLRGKTLQAGFSRIREQSSYEPVFIGALKIK
ncbi:MAG: LIC_10190 family membrane protein [Saprospiraceae bacterium]